MSDKSTSKLSISPRLFTNLLLITTGSILMMTLVVLIGIWRTGNQFWTQFERLFLASPPPKVEVETLVVEKIQGASELTTAVFSTEAIVPASENRQLGEWIVASTQLIYLAYGEVRAGVDLSQLTAQNVTVEDEVVTINLPSPRILDSKIDVTRSRVYDYDRGFLNLGPDVAPKLQTLAQQKTLEQIVSAACNENFLNDANSRAQLTVTQLLNTAGYQEVKVNTTPPDLKTCQNGQIAPDLAITQSSQAQ